MIELLRESEWDVWLFSVLEIVFRGNVWNFKRGWRVRKQKIFRHKICSQLKVFVNGGCECKSIFKLLRDFKRKIGAFFFGIEDISLRELIFFSRPCPPIEFYFKPLFSLSDRITILQYLKCVIFRTVVQKKFCTLSAGLKCYTVGRSYVGNSTRRESRPQVQKISKFQDFRDFFYWYDHLNGRLFMRLTA